VHYAIEEARSDNPRQLVLSGEGRNHGSAVKIATVARKAEVSIALPQAALVADAFETGAFRIDIELLYLLRAIGGVANFRPGKYWKPSAVWMIG
jgi:hypothetical protein